jgi:hypothetical protein
MKKEWMFLIGAVAITLVVTIGLIRWFAPQLLGISADMQVARVNEAIVPFYENVFRKEDYRSQASILKDPYTRFRAKPLVNDFETIGPNDILGFRNRSIPNVADIVVIGDSQTYGNNTIFEETWPSLLGEFLKSKRTTIYNMAVGGWGAVQYLDMFQNATVFQPRVVIVAFYSGNDAIESFQMAYSVERWSGLRPDRKLSLSDMPPSGGFPPPAEDFWSVKLQNGRTMIFSPKQQLTSNQRSNAAVSAGYAIMLEVARQIVHIARSVKIQVVFTVIPSKELVYAGRLRREGISLDPNYLALIQQEQENIKAMADGIRQIADSTYVDLVEPLQQAAMSGQSQLYPEDMDGHPLVGGNRIIAKRLAPMVGDILPVPPRGLMALEKQKDHYQLVLVRNDGYWGFSSEKILIANGWKPGTVTKVSRRDLEGLPFHGMIDVADPSRFGPASVH